MSRAFIIIPARYNSKRFPGKPLALICGKPMIQHVYERASMCRDIAGVYVATDNEKIASCVKGFNGKVVMTSKEHRSGTDRIFEAGSILGLSSEDIVINVQGDQPVFDPAVVSLLVKALHKDPDTSMSTLIYPIEEEKEIPDPNCVKVVTDKNGYAIYFSRSVIPYNRDGKKINYYKHIGIYAYRMGFLKVFTQLPEGSLERAEKLEQLRAIENGYKIKVVMSPSDSVDVDVPQDVEKVERIICADSSSL
ncbi:MAG: 3-deoxy-manno-octulosonate cytidylyltransferase [Deltaproteobacteria bacterium]|nr:MAG: 3-deoxy-manno-octulosonate cytidylyltransferase [Deltaproteobacteria bacterium]